MKTLLLIAVLLLTVIVATAGNYPQQKTWEYKIEFNIREKKANELGAQGWELVAVGSAGSGPTSNVTEYVFKRAR